MMGVKKDEDELNSKTKRRRKTVRKHTRDQVWRRRKKKHTWICDPQAGK